MSKTVFGFSRRWETNEKVQKTLIHHGTLFLSYAMATCDSPIPWGSHETSNTKYISSCACLVSRLYRIIAKPSLGTTVVNGPMPIGWPFLVVFWKRAQKPYFRGHCVIEPGQCASAFNTLLWGYNNGIQRQNISTTDVGIIKDGTGQISRPPFIPEGFVTCNGRVRLKFVT